MRNERFAQQFERVMALHLDDYTRNDIGPLLELVRERLSLMPMSRVLDRVLPGETVIEKAKRVGVSRNTWYAWYRGEVRPNRHQAKRLEELTKIPAAQFAGRR